MSNITIFRAYKVILSMTEEVPMETMCKINSMFTSMEYPIPEEGFDWRLKTERGTVEKRLKQFLYKHGIKPDNSFMGVIGSLIGKQTIRDVDKEYICSFTNTFNWEDGDFGDSGSCFWDNGRFVLQVLMENNVWAMLFWKRNKAELLEGVGRCWVVRRDSENIPYVLFNLYGVEPYKLSMAFEGITGLKLAVVNLENRADNDTLYINDGIGFAAITSEYLDYLKQDKMTGDYWGIPKLDKTIELNIDAFVCDCCGEVFATRREVIDKYTLGLSEYKDTEYVCEYCAIEQGLRDTSSSERT